MQKYLGIVPADIIIREVKNVAPNKRMFCAEFVLTNEILLLGQCGNSNGNTNIPCCGNSSKSMD